MPMIALSRSALMRALFAWLCLALVVLTVSGVAHAAQQSRTEQVTITWLSSQQAVVPGERARVGFQLEMAPHWHTYWLNPGDSGMATRVDWVLPAGWQAGEILWPVPRRIDVGPIANHGYEDRAVLLVDLDVPRDAAVGTPVELRAEVSWLVCQEVCIPQQASLTLPLQVAARAESDPNGAPILAEAAQHLPQPATPPLRTWHASQGLVIGLPAAAAQAQPLQFFAERWGVTQHNAAQVLVTLPGDAGTALLVPHGEDAVKAGEALAGVLRAGDQGWVVQTDVPAAPAAWAAALTNAATLASQSLAGTPEPAGGLGGALSGESWLTWLTAMGLAFLGGVVLNLMPCVFPVLSIKALSLLQHPERTAVQRAWHGGAYTLGVVLSFLLLAGVLLALQATGREIGWGFQFQSPGFVLALALLLFAVGLNLLGVFEIGQGLTGVGGQLAEREGLSGSFFTGVLATVVATPCTAPFMASAVGYALTQPPAVVLAVFTALGLGLAAPYLLLSLWPALQRRLPRPGVWMLRFKQFLAFPMLASVVWLVWVLAQQTGPDGVAIALGALLVLGLAAWVRGVTQGSAVRWQRGGLVVSVALLALGGGSSWWSLPAASQAATPTAASSEWEPFSQARLDALRAEGKPVFVNFTAAWCITCLVNERVALSQDAVAQAFRAQGVTYLKGDWTNQNPEITRVLSQYGRSGVPLYLMFPAGQGTPAAVLPQVLTPDLVVQAVTAAVPVAVSVNRP